MEGCGGACCTPVSAGGARACGRAGTEAVRLVTRLGDMAASVMSVRAFPRVHSCAGRCSCSRCRRRGGILRHSGAFHIAL